MKLTIRKLEKEDILEIQDLYSKTLIDTFAKEGIVDPGQLEISKELAILMKSLSIGVDKKNQNENFLVAIANNNIVGTIVYGAANEIIRTHVNDYKNQFQK